MAIVTLGGEEVYAAAPMPAVVDAVRSALRDLAAGEFEQPVRTGMRDGGFLVMPTHHRPTGTAIVKTVSLNFDRDPAITGTVSWSELKRSDALVADAVAVTAIRTGAISGVATDLLAPADADHLALIGAGAQAADQVRAVQAVRPLQRLTITNRTRPRAEALAAQLADELPGTTIEVADDVATAVAEAHIVTCSTASTESLLLLDQLPESVHVNAIGSFRPHMRELPDELLGDATVFIDDLDSILVEAGEVITSLEAGVIQQSDLIQLGDALGELPELKPRTIFKSVGIAAQDWALMAVLAERVLS